MKVRQVIGPKVLIVDDEIPICETLSDFLRDDGYIVEVANDGLSGLKKMEAFQPQVVLLDVWMPGELDGLAVIQAARPKFSNIEYVIMSGHGTIETAVKATKLGAWDFVEKPLSMDKITILLTNILAFQRERQEKSSLLHRLRKNIALVGESSAMVGLKQMVAQLAPSNSPALITGENGAGKELVAQNMHYLSPRASRAFVDINCAAVPPDLMEFELFGYEKNSVPPSVAARKGRWELADGGTLFLDEVWQLSARAQARVTKALETGRIEREGQTSSCDVRLICASSRDLASEVQAGRFRPDLYARLKGQQLAVSALRERPEDLPALTLHFSEQFAKSGGIRLKVFTEKAMDNMKSYSWPGNVRELRNFVERLYILSEDDRVDIEELEVAGLRSFQDDGTAEDEAALEASSFKTARAKFERAYIIKKLHENSGNISRTAEVIGLERSHLHRKIKAYGIEV